MQSDVNLMPESHRARPPVRVRLVMWSGVLIISLAMLLIAFATVTARINEMRERTYALRLRVEEMRRWGDRATALVSSLQALREHTALEHEMRQPLHWQQLIRDLSHASTAALKLERIAVEATGSEERPDSAAGILTLSGSAQDDREILRFLQAFQASSTVLTLELEQSSIVAAGEGNRKTFIISGLLAPYTESRP